MPDQPLPFRSRSKTAPRAALAEFRQLEQLLRQAAPPTLPEVESIQRRLLSILDELDLRPTADTEARKGRAALEQPALPQPAPPGSSFVPEGQKSRPAIRRVTSKLTIGPWKREKEVQSA